MLLHPSALVVEDDPDNRTLLAEYLTFRGFLVAAAASGEDALALAALFRPQVVLMNLHLGAGIDGLEATRRLRRSPACAGAVIVAVTARCTPPLCQEARDAGCDDVYAKPLELDTLADRLLQRLRDARPAEPARTASASSRVCTIVNLKVRSPSVAISYMRAMPKAGGCGARI